MQVIIDNSNLLELDFYSKVISNIQAANLGDFDIHVRADFPDQPFAPLPRDGRKKVVFSFSDEKHRLPTYAGDEGVVVVFKSYAPSTPHPKLCPIPLPYKKGFKPNSVPFERRNNFFYSGHSNGGSRQELKAVLSDIIFPDSYIQFTEGFNKGLVTEEYAKMLGAHKFAICPTGNSTETFRHIEAVMSGCVLISNHQRAHWYNYNVPYIYVNSWLELPAIFDFFVANPQTALDMHKETLEYYNKFLSLEAVSKVCINTVKHEISK